MDPPAERNRKGEEREDETNDHDDPNLGRPSNEEEEEPRLRVESGSASTLLVQGVPVSASISTVEARVMDSRGNIVHIDSKNTLNNRDPQPSTKKAAPSATKINANNSKGRDVVAANNTPSETVNEEDVFILQKILKTVKSIPETWPRLFALVFGVGVPMLLLICICLFFGYFLAHYESEAEIANNNAIIGEHALVASISQFLGNVSLQVPRICLGITVRNETNAEDFDLEEEIRKELFEIYTRDDPTRFNVSAYDDIRGIDQDKVQNLFDFMRMCGETVWRMTESFTGSRYGFTDEIGSLSFNWIRCYAQADTKDSSHFNRVFGSYVRHPLKSITQLHPNLQEAAVVEAWAVHQGELEEQYLEVLMAKVNYTEDNPMIDERVDVRLEAYQKSVQDADGFGLCESNPDAGAWFWFTIMTTIGYGNTAPETREGRLLVYTVGFLSILVFAVVLGNAGNIVTAIFDDWLSRIKFLSIKQRDWFMCLFWGTLYYTWMCVVAWKTVHWKEEQLGGDFQFEEAYWYSFITTTTVGLGDYYLEHQVLLRRDLIAFSLLILTGFIFLANFLVKLAVLLTVWSPRTKASNLDDQLKATNMMWHLKSSTAENDGYE